MTIHPKDINNAPYIFGSPEEWTVFAEEHNAFMERLPKLQATMDKIISRTASGQTPIDRALMVLGWICANTFNEVITLCGNGLGIGGLKLIRGLYEHAVVLQYLTAFPTELERFFDYNNIHFGKLYLHTAPHFDLGRSISADRREEILTAKKRAEQKFQVPMCETCGTTRNPLSWFEGGVLSMAQKARKQLGLEIGEGLDWLYGVCYFIPTMHVHPTFYAFKEWIEYSEAGMEWKADAQRKQVSLALPMAHFILWHVLKTHNDYFTLGLDAEIEERGEDLMSIWSGPQLRVENYVSDPT
jgi:hypothetical protein